MADHPSTNSSGIRRPFPKAFLTKAHAYGCGGALCVLGNEIALELSYAYPLGNDNWQMATHAAERISAAVRR